MDQATGRLDAWLKATDELREVFDLVAVEEYTRFAQWFDRLDNNHRVFVSGQGRSGLCGQMAAMRLMHLGLRAHFVGEVTAPSIRSGDTLIIVSGSGRTPISVAFAEIAVEQGAAILLITHQADSTLATMASATLALPTHGSSQFGGTLFEESALILLDSIVFDQMQRRRVPLSIMAHNHTNLQ